MNDTDLDNLEKVLSKSTPGEYMTEGGMDLYIFSKGQNDKPDVMIADSGDDSGEIAQARGVGAGLSDEQMANNMRALVAAKNAAPRLIKELREERIKTTALSTMLRRLTGKCNVISAERRHHGTVGEIYSKSVDNMYDIQCQAEALLKDLGL